jgi:hypothetical protein
MTQRHTRTIAKVFIATQLQRVRNQLQLLHASHQFILDSSSSTSQDEMASKQAVIASNTRLINLYTEEALGLRTKIKTWDERQHSKDSMEQEKDKILTPLIIAQKQISSLDEMINNKRKIMLEKSSIQRALRKSLNSISVTEQSKIQRFSKKNSTELNTLQNAISSLRIHYHRAKETIFILENAS